MTDSILTVVPDELAHRYSVKLLNDGTYLAVRDIEPHFCFEGRSATEAVKKAERALNFYAATWGEPA